MASLSRFNSLSSRLHRSARAFSTAACLNRTLTHVDSAGNAHMVDVSHKAPTLRTAVARGYVQMNQETFGLIKQDRIKKGNVLSVAQIAGIQGAKSCPQLVPLCHPISLTKVSVSLELLDDAPLGHRVEIESQARCKGETGVEMEALCAVSAAALTIFDMCKAVSKEMRIGGICVKEKSGGKSGDWCSSKVE
ncbi:hypothetical protein LPJ78_001176 [Coemansia sp. RSA 989]|nr:hypothetical protein LPJ68_000622 [Coemansia sp. RSA 1086]KAJ1867230.1 hypothetical protein LPJ78_001176 [Coemansia sp. RSA 989]KAJ2674060.1 hypothetical protein IWW42_001880 [Coemansia sp. RSA 1085]